MSVGTEETRKEALYKYFEHFVARSHDEFDNVQISKAIDSFCPNLR